MGSIVVFFLCLLNMFLPLEMLGTLTEQLSVTKLLGLGVLGSAVAAFFVGQRWRPLPAALGLQTAYVVWAGLSIIWAFDPSTTQGMLSRLAQTLILSLVVWEFAVTQGQQLWIMRSLLIGLLVPMSMIFASFAGLYSLDVADDEKIRYTGAGHDQNYMAMMLVLGIVLAAYFATSSSRLDRWLRPFYWTFVALAALAAMLTGSRSGFACLCLSSLFVAILAGLSRRRLIYSAAILGFIVVVVVLIRYVVPAALQQRVVDIDTTSGTLGSRISFWQRGLTACFTTNPLAGLGLGCFSVATSELSGVPTGTAHNQVVLVLAELGVVGLLLYLAFLYFVFRAAWRMPQRERILWMGILSIWFLESMAISSQVDKLAWTFWTLVLCQAAVMVRSHTGQRLSSRPGIGLPLGGPPPRPQWRKA